MSDAFDARPSNAMTRDDLFRYARDCDGIAKQLESRCGRETDPDVRLARIVARLCEHLAITQ